VVNDALQGPGQSMSTKVCPSSKIPMKKWRFQLGGSTRSDCAMMRRRRGFLEIPRCDSLHEGGDGMVGDAVIVAGGIGSRMLPASAMVAKEALPLVDVPILNHLCWEAIRAGANRLHLVISEHKAGLELKLKPDEEEIRALQEARPDLPERAFKAIPDGIEILTHFQYVPLGMADAVLQALRSFDGPALVLLGDNLLMDSHPSVKNIGIENASTASLRLVEAFSRTGRPVAGLWSVAESEVSKYGVVAQDGERITEIVEKPDEGSAPSRKVLCGRYLFSAEAKDLLENECNVEKFGELQSIALFHHWMKHDGGFIGVDLDDCQWYDSGRPETWLQAQVDHALRRDDISESMREWLQDRLNQ